MGNKEKTTTKKYRKVFRIIQEEKQELVFWEWVGPLT